MNGSIQSALWLLPCRLYPRKADCKTSTLLIFVQQVLINTNSVQIQAGRVMNTLQCIGVHNHKRRTKNQEGNREQHKKVKCPASNLILLPELHIALGFFGYISFVPRLLSARLEDLSMFSAKKGLPNTTKKNLSWKFLGLAGVKWVLLFFLVSLIVGTSATTPADSLARLVVSCFSLPLP